MTAFLHAHVPVTCGTPDLAFTAFFAGPEIYVLMLRDASPLVGTLFRAQSGHYSCDTLEGELLDGAVSAEAANLTALNGVPLAYLRSDRGPTLMDPATKAALLSALPAALAAAPFLSLHRRLEILRLYRG